MKCLLRFVQRYRPTDREAFMQVEAKFAAMELHRRDWPRGRRYEPLTGREPSNTLIWEAEFPTPADAQAALIKMAGDAEHEKLLAEQLPYMADAYTEIYKLLEF
jgi:hypothetical protein